MKKTTHQLNNPTAANFKSNPIPFSTRHALTRWINALMIFLLQKLGYAESFLGKMQARHHKKLLKRTPFQDYLANEHDVFVATYPKSGTNWMMQLAYQLLSGGNDAFEHIHSVVSWPEEPTPGYSIPLYDDSCWKASPEQKRLIKTHLNWEFLPYSEKAKYILLIRDPKDVFVSGYYFFKGFKRSVFGPAMLSIETWLNHYLSENFLMGGSWAANAAGYWAQRDLPNVLVISYKSMKLDLKGVVVRVADFLGVQASEELISIVHERSSFTYMKQISHKFNMCFKESWLFSAQMIRKGEQGGSSELLTHSQQQAIDAYFMAELKRIGSDLPYEEFCNITY